MARKVEGLDVSTNPVPVTNKTTIDNIFSYERIDAPELARRLNLPVSWIRDQVRRRCSDPIPCEDFGKYQRFLWGSPKLAAWLERRQRGSSNSVSQLPPRQAHREPPQIRPRTARVNDAGIALVRKRT